MNNRELESRVVDFSTNVMNWAYHLGKEGAVSNMKDQILRSVSAVALNYGEAQSAESKKDFIHKIGIVLKELRETSINLKILGKLDFIQKDQKIESMLKESDELIAIFYKTLQTARKK